jgi:O-antigen ligase
VRPPAAVRRLPAPTREAAVIAVAGVLGTLLTVAAAFKLGLAGLALPIVVMAAVLLLRFPGPMLVLAVAAVVICENDDFGLFPQTAQLYTDLVKGFMPIDAILALSLIGIAAQVVQDRRPVRLPPAPLALTLALLGLALASGILVGRDAGNGVTDSLLKVHTFVYLALVPLMAANLRVGRRDVLRVLWLGVALALAKGLLGLLVVATGRGLSFDASVITYYEPAANWLMTVALLSIIAAVLGRARPPLWVIGAAPILLLALVLSYRRSFWIADLLGIALVVLLGLSSGGRKVALPGAVLVGAAIWALGGVAVQSDTPLGQRVQSLSAANIQAKPDDRYRLDERANVVAEIRKHPVAGLGIGIPWDASARPLPVEVNPDHQYVHFAVLYWWLKLGVLGMLAYLAMVLTALLMSFRIWKHAPEPFVRAFGLGSLCSIVGLVVIETTATFSGTDARFTLVLAGQLALLGVLWRRADPAARPVAEGPADQPASSALTAAV